MKKKPLFGFFAVVVFLTGLDIYISGQSTGARPPGAVLERSRDVYQKIKSVPPEKRNTDERLMLLHAAYNLEKFGECSRHAENLYQVLLLLPESRRHALGSIALECLSKAGRKQLSMNLRRDLQARGKVTRGV